MNLKYMPCQGQMSGQMIMEHMKILPPIPIVRLQLGTPRKARRKAPNKPINPYKISRSEYEVTCSGNCGGIGHNHKGCPQPKNPNRKRRKLNKEEK